MADKKTNTIKIKLVRSLIGSSDKQRKVVKGLGLTKKDQIVEHSETATIMGLVNKVSHLVEIVK